MKLKNIKNKSPLCKIIMALLLFTFYFGWSDNSHASSFCLSLYSNSVENSAKNTVRSSSVKNSSENSIQEQAQTKADSINQSFDEESKKLDSEFNNILASLSKTDPQTEAELRLAIKETSTIFRETKDLKLALIMAQQIFHFSEIFTLKLYMQLKSSLFRSLARHVYRPLLEGGRAGAEHIGHIWRTYISKSEMSLQKARWNWLTKLHNTGVDENGFGAPLLQQTPRILGKNTPPTQKELDQIRQHIELIGKNLILDNGDVVEVEPFKKSQMINLSGMSYPALSVNAVLSLLYIHVKLAKDGIRYTYNTGEGGGLIHLLLLNKNTNKENLTAAVTRYAISSGLSHSRLQQAEIERTVEKLIEDRDSLFKEFSQEDLDQAQIIFQIGSALNGVRGAEDKIDYETLKKLSQMKSYAGTQIKIKQAAKFGSKVTAGKIGTLAAWLRKVKSGSAFVSPNASLEWETPEALAKTILITKMVTKKPVSIKFSIGQADEIYDMMLYLRDVGALPDHIQLDGSGYIHNAGSGNAPLSAGNTSLNITTAVMVMDTILKKLNIRDQIYVEATGDVVFPEEALMNESMGANGVAAGRSWLGMGVGCTLVLQCHSAACVNGIASADGSLYSESLNPKVVGPRGAIAAKQWFDMYTKQKLVSGAKGETPYYQQFPIYSEKSPPNISITGPFTTHPLSEVFPIKEIQYALRNRISKEDVEFLLTNENGNEIVSTQANNSDANSFANTNSAMDTKSRIGTRINTDSGVKTQQSAEVTNEVIREILDPPF